MTVTNFKTQRFGASDCRNFCAVDFLDISWILLYINISAMQNITDLKVDLKSLVLKYIPLYDRLSSSLPEFQPYIQNSVLDEINYIKSLYKHEFQPDMP